ncbi:MAG TPA: S24/S26 family peptidase [Bryobacteraceae bacterium]|nr:S24/S26 family peptidase [Bryobacteraceae bacterium]
MVEILKFDLATEVLASFGEARLPVTGSSMFPCMQPGDLLEIRRPSALIQTGEVVVFDRHSRLVVHRVVGRTGDLLITRGDRLRYPDAPVPAAAVLGCVTAIERRGRRIAPRLTLWRRIVSAVLRYTEFGTRVALYSVRMVRT